MALDLTITELNGQLVDTVKASLGKTGQKQLPYSWFYDEIGSALFEVITLLPEYGLTRAEARLLRRYAHTIVNRLTGSISVAELGSGTGTKTRWILEAQRSRGSLRYYPIDISSSALDRCERDMQALMGIPVDKLNKSYLDGLEQVVAVRPADEALLVLFLGSSIGNLQPAEADTLLGDIRRLLKKGDALLLGTDLQKGTARMLAAYDDALGVTAAFNLNLLGHLNRALGTDFDLAGFAHEVRYNQQEHRIEMHLRSLRDQTVTIPDGNFRVHLRQNETIWTESSYKYRPEQIHEMAQRLGFNPGGQWIDEEWSFAANLWLV